MSLLGTVPYLFSPAVPGKQARIINTIAPINGIKPINIHHPLKLISCNLLILKPKEGSKIAIEISILKIPADAEFGIECSGGHGNVRYSFGEPQINNDNGVWKITLNADTNNRISLNGNETPMITVTIPDSIYYEYTDGSFGKVNVTLGKKQVVKYQIGIEPIIY